METHNRGEKMNKIKTYREIYNKKNKVITNKKSIFSSFFTSILKFSLAIALLTIITFFVTAGDVIVQSGKIDVDSKLYVDDVGNVGIGMMNPSEALYVVGNIYATGDVTCGGSCGGSGSGGTRETIEFIGCEDDATEEAKWEDDNLGIAGSLLCKSNAELGDATARTGTYSLAMTGNFDPNLDQWNRTIDLSGYQDVSISLWTSTEDTEAADSYKIYYWNGSIWVQMVDETRRSASSQVSWQETVVPIPNSAVTSSFQIRVEWETSSTDEHMMLDDVNITGIPLGGGGSLWTAGSGDDIYTQNGNVGIGTTNPSQKLDVTGQIHATADICTDAGGGECLSTAGGGGIDAAPYVVYDNTGNVPITGTEATLNLDTVGISSSNYVLSADTVTFNVGGSYHICYGVSYDITDTSGGTRGALTSHVEEDSSGSFNDVQWSFASSYHRETAGRSGTTACFNLDLNAGDSMRVRVQRTTGTTNIDTTPGESQLSIHRIK